MKSSQNMRITPYVLFFQCTSDATHYWGVYIAPVEYIQQVDTIFSGLYFERLRVKALESTPEKMLQELQEKSRTEGADRRTAKTN